MNSTEALDLQKVLEKKKAVVIVDGIIGLEMAACGADLERKLLLSNFWEELELLELTKRLREFLAFFFFGLNNYTSVIS